jgi:hypothetical protein
MTTEEFLPCIEALEMDNDLAQRLRSLCRAMDPVKFGGETVWRNRWKPTFSLPGSLCGKPNFGGRKWKKGEQHIETSPQTMEIPKNKSQMQINSNSQYPKENIIARLLFGI